jgi:hypothetical protein
MIPDPIPPENWSRKNSIGMISKAAKTTEPLQYISAPSPNSIFTYTECIYLVDLLIVYHLVNAISYCMSQSRFKYFYKPNLI